MADANNNTYDLADGDTLPLDSDALAGNNYIFGTDGADTIVAGPEDPVLKDNGRNEIEDNDVILGREGDDLMSGGYGNDKFVFSFSFEETQTVRFWEGDKIETDAAPDLNANLRGWQSSYAEWVAEMTAQGFTIDASQTDTTVTVGRVSPTSFSFDNVATRGGGLVSADGHDTIMDFKWSTGNNEKDHLVLQGVDVAKWTSYFDVTRVDTDGANGVDSIKVSGGGWSVVLKDFDVADVSDANLKTWVWDHIVDHSGAYDLLV